MTRTTLLDEVIPRSRPCQRAAWRLAVAPKLEVERRSLGLRGGRRWGVPSNRSGIATLFTAGKSDAATRRPSTSWLPGIGASVGWPTAHRSWAGDE
jgi:hypothetical protein